MLSPRVCLNDTDGRLIDLGTVHDLIKHAGHGGPLSA